MRTHLLNRVVREKEQSPKSELRAVASVGDPSFRCGGKLAMSAQFRGGVTETDVAEGLAGIVVICLRVKEGM